MRKEELRTYIENHESEMIEDLKSLIRIPSEKQAAEPGKPFGAPAAEALAQGIEILEKHGWSERAAERILNAYSARRPLDEGEIETLRLYLSYPWKYWKLANRYYGSRKSWISGRNTEKLKTLNAQQADWLRFVKGSFF